MATREAQSRWRAKRRREDAHAAAQAIPPDKLATTFLTAVLDWSGNGGAAARSVGLQAAEQLDDLEAEPADEDARVRLARALGVGLGEASEDMARQRAIGILADVQVDMTTGTATVGTVRAGLRAAKVLARRRTRVNDDEVKSTMARLLGGGLPPAELVERAEENQ